MIAAIQTSYNGVLYRSRQEARWAVFFDTLHIPFHYEYEGYSLPSGNYLPDFFLPEQDSFVEVKGKWPSDEEEQKASDLSAATVKRVFIFWGPLEPPDFSGPEISGKYVEGGVDYSHWWCECPRCARLDIQFNGRADRISCGCQRSEHGDKGYNSDSPRLVDAFARARRERFGT